MSIGYRGFGSVSEYERAARSHGLAVERIPYHKEGEEGKYFVMITWSETETDTSVKVWVLFPHDESREIMSGIIDGLPWNFQGKLAAAGYFPDE